MAGRAGAGARGRAALHVEAPGHVDHARDVIVLGRIQHHAAAGLAVPQQAPRGAALAAQPLHRRAHVLGLPDAPLVSPPRACPQPAGHSPGFTAARASPACWTHSGVTAARMTPEPDGHAVVTTAATSRPGVLSQSASTRRPANARCGSATCVPCNAELKQVGGRAAAAWGWACPAAAAGIAQGPQRPDSRPLQLTLGVHAHQMPAGDGP